MHARKMADRNSQAGLQIFLNFTLNISHLNMKIKRNNHRWNYISFEWNCVTNSSITMMATNILLLLLKHYYTITRVQYQFSYWRFLPHSYCILTVKFHYWTNKFGVLIS
jgi:hypothetical protein